MITSCKNDTNLLPPKLHSTLIGFMLGDGHIYKTSPTSNSRFEISFGKDRELFANWISDLFKDYSNTGIKKLSVMSLASQLTAPTSCGEVASQGEKNKDNLTTKFLNFRFKTKTLPLFNYYHEIFYLGCEPQNNGAIKYKKIVPKEILNLMNPIVLSYLIMTDGNFDKSRKRIRIYTNSYKKEEVEALAKAIQINLGYYVGVLHDRKDQWILTIGARELDNLRENLKPYFESSMLYRIGL